MVRELLRSTASRRHYPRSSVVSPMAAVETQSTTRSASPSILLTPRTSSPSRSASGQPLSSFRGRRLLDQGRVTSPPAVSKRGMVNVGDKPVEIVASSGPQDTPSSTVVESSEDPLASCSPRRQVGPFSRGVEKDTRSAGALQPSIKPPHHVQGEVYAVLTKERVSPHAVLQAATGPSSTFRTTDVPGPPSSLGGAEMCMPATTSHGNRLMGSRWPW